MTQYSSVTIIYNPISTGPGKALAKELKASLSEKMPKLPVKVVATKYAGHAEKLAYELAMASPRPLIISASGDGGYNEVVNGLMTAVDQGAQPVAGLLPAGNANDHFNNVHQGDLAISIVEMHEQYIDLLKFIAVSKGQKLERYAHSYVGIGLTPKAGKELNKTKLNRLNEIWIVVKVLVKLKPVRLIIDGKHRSYDSLVFSNINRMSKVLTISQEAEINDGLFEVTPFRRGNKFKLISKLLKASTTGLTTSKQTAEFSFKTLRSVLVQLDGEVTTIDARTTAIITLDRSALRCLL